MSSNAENSKLTRSLIIDRRGKRKRRDSAGGELARRPPRLERRGRPEIDPLPAAASRDQGPPHGNACEHKDAATVRRIKQAAQSLFLVIVVRWQAAMYSPASRNTWSCRYRTEKSDRRRAGPIRHPFASLDLDRLRLRCGVGGAWRGRVHPSSRCNCIAEYQSEAALDDPCGRSRRPAAPIAKPASK